MHKEQTNLVCNVGKVEAEIDQERQGLSRARLKIHNEEEVKEIRTYILVLRDSGWTRCHKTGRQHGTTSY